MNHELGNSAARPEEEKISKQQNEEAEVGQPELDKDQKTESQPQKWDFYRDGQDLDFDN